MGFMKKEEVIEMTKKVLLDFIKKFFTLFAVSGVLLLFQIYQEVSWSYVNIAIVSPKNKLQRRVIILF